MLGPCRSCAAASARNLPLAKSIPKEIRATRVLARVCVDLKSFEGPIGKHEKRLHVFYGFG